MVQSFFIAPTHLIGFVHQVSFPKAVLLVRKSIDIDS